LNQYIVIWILASVGSYLWLLIASRMLVVWRDNLKNILLIIGASIPLSIIIYYYLLKARYELGYPSQLEVMVWSSNAILAYVPALALTKKKAVYLMQLLYGLASVSYSYTLIKNTMNNFLLFLTILLLAVIIGIVTTGYNILNTSTLILPVFLLLYNSIPNAAINRYAVIGINLFMLTLYSLLVYFSTDLNNILTYLEKNDK